MLTLLLFVYIIGGLICVGISIPTVVNPPVFSHNEQYWSPWKRYAVYLAVLLIVFLTWPVWVGLWVISPRFPKW
jgi:hypothetical protein